ncbi:MAG: hypothetical protein QG628_428 [Patescibacteria group bacterium]|nr:hypothetical protein [Patescibacteria group bacterium]
MSFAKNSLEPALVLKHKPAEKDTYPQLLTLVQMGCYYLIVRTSRIYKTAKVSDDDKTVHMDKESHGVFGRSE